MKTIEIDVQPRSLTGRSHNNKIRKVGHIPAVVYSSKGKNQNVQLPLKTASTLIKGEDNAIITFKSDDKGLHGLHVLLKDWDREIHTRQPLHMDFFEIDMNKPVRIKVALHFVGKAKGIKEGGMISHVARDVEVEVLPSKIPDFIEVDVTNLGVGDSLHINDLVVPEGVKKVFHDNYTLATCVVVKEEVIAAPVAAEGAPAVAEPEVIAKGKKDAEGEAGADGKGAKPDAKAAPAKGGDKK